MAGRDTPDNRAATPERTLAFSDGVFSVIITILVLDLHPPDAATVDALLSLWPAALSYGASYLFLTIVWLNHHYLMAVCRCGDTASAVGQFRPKRPQTSGAISRLHGSRARI